MKKHPLTRALRPDKLTLAGLEATLRLYRAGRAWSDVPILRRIARPESDVRAAAERLADALREAAPALSVEVVSTVAEVGGGSLPGHSLPSWAVAVSTPGQSTDETARALRKAPFRSMDVSNETGCCWTCAPWMRTKKRRSRRHFLSLSLTIYDKLNL